MPFRDRVDAGRRLAQRLAAMELQSPVVLALRRGGVPVAAEIATELGAPMDVFVARKVGAPGHQEFGIGAVAEGWDGIVVSDTARQLGIGDREMQGLAASAHRELDRRVGLYRRDRSLPELAGRDVVLVDDGLATGVTAEAALRSLRLQQPARLILAVPVCARETATRLGAVADEVVCVEAPVEFFAVGQWYENFSQTTDDEVLDLLERGRPVAKR